MTYKTTYCLRHPKSGAIRYVGATTDLIRRLANHVAQSSYQTHPCAVWVRSLVAQGLRPTIHLLVGPSLDWARYEREYIKLFRAEGKRLLNMTDGGLGMAGCKPGAMTRAKRSRTLKTRYANDPIQMAARQELARKAARSANGRAAASARMTAIWANPERAAAMRKCMQGAKARKAAR